MADEWMWVRIVGGMIPTGVNQSAQRDLPHWHFVYRKRYTEWPATDPVLFDNTPLCNHLQCRRDGGEKPIQITGDRRSGKGSARPTCICFCLSRCYHYLPTAQINPFRPSPSHSATERQSFRFSVKMISRSTLADGGRHRSQRPCPPQPPPPRGWQRWRCVSPQKHVWISVQALFTRITQMSKCPKILIIY